MSPNLGVVKYYDNSFVIADIPGLIEGAAEGAGLGHDFLRHIERVRLIVHVVDISGVEDRDPVSDFEKINAELDAYSIKLAGLKQIVVANKCDLLGDLADEAVDDFEKRTGIRPLKMSAIMQDGIKVLLDEIWNTLKDIPESEPFEVDEDFQFEIVDNQSYEIDRMDDGTFVVSGGFIDMLSKNVVISDVDSNRYFQKKLIERGIIDDLRRRGAKEGDTVEIGDIEFEFVD